MVKKIYKSRGRFWYYCDNHKQPLNKCGCGRFKVVHAGTCFRCAGLKRNGTFKKKPSFKKRFKQQGYVYIFRPAHHRALRNGYVGEHILIAERKAKRLLKENEIVHHKDKVRDNNSPKNLLIMDYKDHNRLHATVGKDPMRYGKYLSHKHDLCRCGNLKDTRSKRCILCVRKHAGRC